MKTPETKAGRLTELVMARVRGKLPELPTHEYNRVYECVLAELNCHVLGETYEIPKPSAEPANEKSSATGDPKSSPAKAELTAPTPVGWSELLGVAPEIVQKEIGK